MKKKNTKATCRKGVTFLTAALLTAALAGSQALPAAAGDYHTEIEAWTLIPDNVTIDEPTELYNISLPGSSYGSLYWVNDSYIPTERVQSCEVAFEPAEGVDLSGLSGWDSEAGVLTGYVTVVVNNLDSDYEEEEYSDYEEDSEYEYENSDEEDENDSEGDENETQEGDTSEDQDTSENQDTSDGNNEVTETPVPTEEAEVTGTPMPTEGAEVTGTPAPTEEAEVTGTPVPTEEAEVTGTPAPTEEVEVTGTPVPTEEPDSIFDEEELPEEERPAAVENEEELTEDEIRDYAQSNHSCAGISVSGIELPWYVQFRVSDGESYEYTNEESAEIFRSYEFELWDLKNDTEYEIPDGEYISVTVPVKAGYEYTVEHHLDNGAMETIVPSVEGSIMVFSTHSFSPFGIAGSRPLVGDDVNNIIYPTITPTSAPRATQAPSVTNTVSGGSSSNGSTVPAGSSNNSSSTVSAGSGSNSSSTVSAGSSNNSSNTVSGGDTGSTSSASVNTGDYTAILPFVILIVAAAVIIIVIIVVRKKKKK